MMAKGYSINKHTLSHLKEGDIMIMRPVSKYMIFKYPIAWLILTFTHSQWTHAAVYNGDNLILESTGKGVAINNPAITTHYNDYRFIAFRFKSHTNQIQFLKHAREKVGLSYDIPQAFMVGLLDYLYDITGLTVIKESTHNFDSPNKYICSELVSDSLFETGIDIRRYLKIDRSQMLPDDIIKLASIFLDVVPMCNN